MVHMTVRIPVSVKTMTKRALWAFTICLFMAVPLLAVAGDIEKGKDIYRESCRHCHGVSGQGDGQMAEYLNPRPADLASQSTQAKTDQELKEVILKGRAGTAMVGLEGALEEVQLNDLMAFIRSLKP